MIPHEESRKSQNSLMDYFDLKLGDIDSLLRDEVSDLKNKPKLEKIDDRREESNKYSQKELLENTALISDEFFF